MQSQAARLALAIQAAKGTGVTTGYTGLITTLSRLLPEFRYAEFPNEHGIGNERSTTNKTQRDKASIIYRLRAEGGAYPHALGMYLVGLGFTPTTTGTTLYTHVFRKASNANAKYLSALHSIGEGAGRFHRRVRDVRLTNLQIQADNERLGMQVDGVGLWEEPSTGAETVAVPATVRYLPSTGSFAWDTITVLGTPRGHTITVARPVDENDQLQHAFGLNDAEESGFSLTGQMTGVTMSKATYDLLVLNNTTSPSTVTITDGLTFNYESGGVISGQAVPYSWEFDIRKCDVTIGNFEASANNTIRCDINWQMIDDDPVLDPVTITVVDTKASYA